MYSIEFTITVMSLLRMKLYGSHELTVVTLFNATVFKHQIKKMVLPQCKAMEMQLKLA